MISYQGMINPLIASSINIRRADALQTLENSHIKFARLAVKNNTLPSDHLSEQPLTRVPDHLPPPNSKLLLFLFSTDD